MGFPPASLGLSEGNLRWGFAPSPQKSLKILALYPQANHPEQFAGGTSPRRKQRLTAMPNGHVGLVTAHVTKRAVRLAVSRTETQ